MCLGNRYDNKLFIINLTAKSIKLAGLWKFFKKKHTQYELRTIILENVEFLWTHSNPHKSCFTINIIKDKTSITMATIVITIF